MWMKFPAGVERISVQQQQFTTEFTDDEGNSYTRVPNHFSAILLPLGFRVAQQPEGAPDDLVPTDPLRDGAIADLSRENETLRRDVTSLKSDVVALRAQITALMNEREQLKTKLATSEKKVAELEEEAEDKE